MLVEATGGDLGEADLSKPRVTGVTHDRDGQLETIVVQKGVLFNKTLEISADRIESVEQATGERKIEPNERTDAEFGLDALCMGLGHVENDTRRAAAGVQRDLQVLDVVVECRRVERDRSGVDFVGRAIPFAQRRPYIVLCYHREPF